MAFRLPKLRLPTLTEVLALFHISVNVSAILAGVTKQIAALDAAASHHLAQADKHTNTSIMSGIAADASKVEAARALRVADKLVALTA